MCMNLKKCLNIICYVHIHFSEGELQIEDKYKKALEEIEMLKEHLGKSSWFTMNNSYWLLYIFHPI